MLVNFVFEPPPDRNVVILLHHPSNSVVHGGTAYPFFLGDVVNRPFIEDLHPGASLSLREILGDFRHELLVFSGVFAVGICLWFGDRRMKPRYSTTIAARKINGF